MKENNLQTITKIFEGKEIRSFWDSNKEDYYFSVIDVIKALTDNNYQQSRKYWSVLKVRLKNEGSELATNCSRLKMRAQDGKLRETDTLDTKGIFRLIESVPSKKAEPFKLWLAKLGKERIDEVFDPEIAVNRAVNYYRAKGYPDAWIKQRLIGIIDRFKLTDTWARGGIEKPFEFAVLTNEIYKEWSGMNAKEYKEYKGLRKESLRDNMTEIELALTNIGEITTRDIAANESPMGLEENKSVARRGGSVAKGARELYEKETKRKAISQENFLNYKYARDKKQIEKSVKIE